MGLIIDGFSHILPQSFAEALMQAHPTDELRELSVLKHFGEVENRVRILDKHKIDKQVLTCARPSIWINVPEEAVMDLTRAANDAVSDVARQFPDRFIPVGTLPIPNEKFMPEFDRCVEELGMVGIQIFSSVGRRALDAPEFRPFFAKAHETRTPIWIHPQLLFEWSPEFCLDKIFGWLYETSLALSRLVFSGIMAEYPDLRIISHHLGAMVPHFSERIKGFYDARDMFPRAKFVPLPKEPLEYFKKFYGDSVLNGAVHAFECGHRFFGPEHIIFATDYPFGPGKGETWIEGTFHQMEAADFPQQEKDQILGENLQRLIEKR